MKKKKTVFEIGFNSLLTFNNLVTDMELSNGNNGELPLVEWRGWIKKKKRKK
jgi:hypothetical protein